VHIARIVSGGQTGVDRAALDAARDHGRAYGGWCPAGGWAEDHPDPPGLLVDYPGLRATPSRDPAERTRWNVRDSDATIVMAAGGRSPGTDLTIETAARIGRPCLVTSGSPEDVDEWLGDLGDGLTLNVAGPRESERPGIYRATRELLDRVLRADR
jgi:hypothetical protein